MVDSMRFASFNVNSIRARLPIAPCPPQKHQPDVLAMQETKVQDENFQRRIRSNRLPVRLPRPEELQRRGLGLPSRHGARGVRPARRASRRGTDHLSRRSEASPWSIRTFRRGTSADTDKFQYKLDWFARLLNWFQSRFQPTDPVLGGWET